MTNIIFFSERINLKKKNQEHQRVEHPPLTLLVRPVGHHQVQDVGVQVLVLGAQDAQHQAGGQVDVLVFVLMDRLDDNNNNRWFVYSLTP